MFTLFNNGTVFDFDPTKTVSDPNSKTLRTQLEVTREFVRNASQADVFILDNHGDVLDI